MKNCDELRTSLAETFAQLKAGTIKPGEASELANLAGKMINSAKVQVEYYALRKEAPKIDVTLLCERALDAALVIDRMNQRHISYVCPQCHWTLDTHPAATLSDDEIAAIASQHNTGRANGDYDFARAIERAVLGANQP
jgi:uncharacterized protein YgbK (DUF1537 family)